MLEDWEEFTLLILMTKITKKLSKNARIKLERLVAAAMPCKSKAQTSTTKVAAKQEIASHEILKLFMFE